MVKINLIVVDHLGYHKNIIVAYVYCWPNFLLIVATLVFIPALDLISICFLTKNQIVYLEFI